MPEQQDTVFEKLEVYKKCIKTFEAARGLHEAEAVFKRIFCKVVVERVAAGADLETDEEFLGLATIAHTVFVEANRVASIFEECRALFGVKGLWTIGRKMIDSETQ